MVLNAQKTSFFAKVALALVLSVLSAVTTVHAQSSDDDKGKQAMSYAQVLFMNKCSRDYYNFFNPGDKLDSKGEKQMVNHIKASCQCMYKNLNQVFSESHIMQYIQSRHVSRQVGVDHYGDTPDQVYEMMTSEKLREECRHMNDMGASYEEGS